MTPREILDIVELAYYAPVLVLGVLICLRHGFKRADGWIYIVILALLRLIGCSTGVAYVYDNSNLSLLACEIVCQTVGLSPLLLVLLGFTGRIGRSATSPPVSPKILRASYLPVLVALILGILAGTDGFSTDLNTQIKSHHYAEATSILYLASFLAVTVILVITFVNRNTVRRTDMKLLYAGLIVLPFILVRILYSVAASFDYTNKRTFSLYSDATRPVLVEAILAVLMEMIAVGIYITAAMLTPRPEAAAEPGSSRQAQEHDPETYAKSGEV